MSRPRTPSARIQPIPGLLIPFSPRGGAIELARGVLLELSAAPGTPAAQGVYTWAVRDELSPLFAGSPLPQEPLREQGWVTAFQVREARLPASASALADAPNYGVSVNVVDILDAAIKSSLPQRRLSGWCALLCLCALNRTDL